MTANLLILGAIFLCSYWQKSRGFKQLSTIVLYMHLSDTSAWYETKAECKPNPLDSTKSFVVLTKCKDMCWLAETISKLSGRKPSERKPPRLTSPMCKNGLREGKSCKGEAGLTAWKACVHARFEMHGLIHVPEALRSALLFYFGRSISFALSTFYHVFNLCLFVSLVFGN